MPLTINVTETREVPILVTGINLTDNLIIDPTASPVTVGFVSSADGGRVAPSVFYSASWISNPAANAYYAVVLVGPLGVVALPAGTYVPWPNFTHGGEVVIQAAQDTLTVLP